MPSPDEYMADLVEEWHTSDEAEGSEIYEWIGVSWEDYGDWVMGNITSEELLFEKREYKGL